MNKDLINIHINGKALQAPANMSVIQAAWYAGESHIQGVGCLEGVCGSCRVMVKYADSQTVVTTLACQTRIAADMQVIFLDFPSQVHHRYQLNEIKDSWHVYDYFHKTFPEASHCRHCGGCDAACPKGIAVEKGVQLAVEGRFRQAGELFFTCVMCDLCLTACPEEIAPNHVGVFARRVIPYFHLRPSNLVSRLEEIKHGKLTVEIDGK